jgi:hypothetical protein
VGRDRDQRNKPKQQAKHDKPITPVNETAGDPILVMTSPAPPPSAESPKPPIYKTPPFWQAVFSGALVLNAIFTYALLREQRLLTRQQVVGTQAAEVHYSLTMYSPDYALSVSFDPRGAVAARDVRLKFRAVRQRIPELTDIEEPIEKEIYEPVFSKDSIYQPHDFSLPGLTPGEFEAIKRTEQTVKVEGDFSFDNGFGDIRKERVCQYWLIGIQNVTESEGGANGFFPCDGFKIRMNNVLKARREAAH